MTKSRYKPGGFDLAVRQARAGKGLFAKEDIPKGACVVEYFGRTLTQEEEYTSRSRYLFEVTKKKTIDGWYKGNVARYINHSCKPNCEVEIHKKRVWVFAKRKIKAGEELGYDYGKSYFNEFLKPIGCRCTKCMSEKKWAKVQAKEAKKKKVKKAEKKA
ncbi:MAG: SET domain-containing protein [Methyloceanibacter sp.]|nr:SET domain-containing protein [Methyloceanibacter sp.]